VRCSIAWVSGLCVALVAVGVTVAAQPAPGPFPAWATWTQKDLIVKLDPLPKRYACNALWYKFRDVLLAIGAKPGLSVLVYPCEGKGDLAARDPSVHVQFFMPEVLPHAQAGWAQFKAAPKSVELGPGHPASLDASDCDLLRQMKGALLDSLVSHIDKASLACQPASGGSTPSFGLKLETLVSVDTP
jgi:hypothetical protein